MAIKKYGPTTPGRRGMTVTDYSVLSKVAPERSLLEPMKKHSGRNNTGKITVRPRSRPSSMIPTAARSSAWWSTPTASRAISSAPRA